MTVNEIRQAYFDFFKERGHVVIPSVPLVPENDPTTLFVSSGMQPLLPYFLGKAHPSGTRVANSQLSFRAQDIEEIGDNRHTTAFEMLGNWSFGDYFKAEQLPWFFEFLTGTLEISAERLWVTCFEGDEKTGIPRDTESADIWKELGIPDSRILFYDAKKNWWSRSGVPDSMPAGEPGGPDSEVFYDFKTPHDPAYGEKCHPNCDCGRFMEIGNSVFMEYVKQDDGSFKKLPKANVDFGGGLERLTAAAIDTPDIFLIDTMQTVIAHLAEVSGKSYDDPEYQASFRIVADHIRGSTFMINDGVLPANTDQGYVLRRLIRRAIRHLDRLGAGEGVMGAASEQVIDAYRETYPKLDAERLTIRNTIRDEELKFRKTLAQGMKEFEKILVSSRNGRRPTSTISGEGAFVLFSTYGFPYELTEELAREHGMTIDLGEFEKEMKKHQELSRAGAEQKFKGGLADASEQTTKLHTATHLMLAGLRKYVGDHVHQAGSNITAERTRFDFTNLGKVPRETLDKVESYVNEAIQKGCDVIIEQMPKEKAKEEGVEGSFWGKYPDIVNVYMVKCSDGSVYSRELCGGPHVTNTATMGTFKITKEEASSSGIRRIKAVLE